MMILAMQPPSVLTVASHETAQSHFAGASVCKGASEGFMDAAVVFVRVL